MPNVATPAESSLTTGPAGNSSDPRRLVVCAIPKQDSLQNVTDSLVSAKPFDSVSRGLSIRGHNGSPYFHVQGGSVQISLIETLNNAKLPPEVLHEVMFLLNRQPDVDVNDAAQAGDGYRVAYVSDHDGNDNGETYRMSALQVHLGRASFEAERFPSDKAGPARFFSFNGKPLANSRFIDPIPSAIITSPFGVREHPVKGGLHQHTGVDLSAPFGTPVRAAAEGTITTIGFDRSGYGRYVVLQHSDGYSTWYAHLSSIFSTVRVGLRLSVGQLLGKVGRTGDATGPHLHFEVRYNARPTDPQLLMGPAAGSALTGSDMLSFSRQTAVIRRAFQLPMMTENAADLSVSKPGLC
ncbi:M23 family metallopeptidase [Paraburkholderia sp. SIMBA_054]|uniref:M23 family metallopeptidase n=1 Tax=Paraburkholderia sp. SIMBA_054 TaxID=3085795 RepID=UPI0039793EA2